MTFHKVWFLLGHHPVYSNFQDHPCFCIPPLFGFIFYRLNYSQSPNWPPFSLQFYLIELKNENIISPFLCSKVIQWLSIAYRINSECLTMFHEDFLFQLLLSPLTSLIRCLTLYPVATPTCLHFPTHIRPSLAFLNLLEQLNSWELRTTRSSKMDKGHVEAGASLWAQVSSFYFPSCLEISFTEKN